MIENCIDKKDARSAFLAGVLCETMGKSASCKGVAGLEKSAFWKDALKILGKMYSGAIDIVKSAPGLAAATVLSGAGAGALGTLAYDAVKENLTEQDPRDKLNNELTVHYKLRSRELEDAKWMSNVRSKRDALVRDGKKMDPETYKKMYEELVNLLNEKENV